MTATSSSVVIGAAAGGVIAMQRLLAQFGDEWPVSVFITIHIGKYRSRMPEVLNFTSPLRVAFAEHNMPFSRGVYIAPPDRHMIVEETRILLSAGPTENHARPAIDPMFRSAAKHHGSNVTGVLLTGHLNDGVNGLHEIHKCGGTTIVQHPADAEVPEIPKNALARLQPDYVLPLAEIPRAIFRQLEHSKRIIPARS
jgi:two-component system, chemotaxis family, protein-glutamate methylesterase/glutaminase